MSEVSGSPLPERITRHLATFNEAVLRGDFDAFVATFASDAEMYFVGVPAGPFRGRDAILAAYRASPPTDTMAVVSSRTDGATDLMRFRWSRGGEGTMTLRWLGEQVELLEVAFDPA